MTKSKSEENKASSNLPFAMQVVSNPKVTVANKGAPGVLIGAQAMIAVGAQSEFVTANIMQAHALNCSIILRAGDPPQYNKNRGPKSGVNLSKTSKQGFFKGALAEEVRFARIENGKPKPHHAKDEAHLSLKPTDPEYQHTMQLDINMRDILREVGPEGDLRVLGFNPYTGLLRFEYKEGRGPSPDSNPPPGFNGQFVVNLSAGENNPIFYSREWDKAEHDKDWDASQGIITKPPELAIPDELYKKIFNHTFKLQYTESKSPNPDESELKNAKVFANRARSAEEFKQTMGADHPHYGLIEKCSTLEKVLDELKTQLGEEVASQVILEVYNKGGLIVAGDWDGMALGHPPGLNPKYAEVINVFAPKEEGIRNKEELLDRSDAYLEEIQEQAKQKKLEGTPLSSFEEKALSIPSITEIVSDFALARAGCITPHEFVYQQVLNHAYRDTLNAHYGEKYDTDAVQKAMDKLVSLKDIVTQDNILQVAKQLVQAEMMLTHDHISSTLLNQIAEHMASHFILATKNQDPYVLPHLQHDVNVHDLYQHGFDMRNPYGSNLEGAWLLITADGSTIYGETQEQLVEVLLTGDFLEKNHIEVNHGADMKAGWERVIERQLQLKQTIPPQTMAAYEEFHKAQHMSRFKQCKEQVTQLKIAAGVTPNSENDSEHEATKRGTNTF